MTELHVRGRRAVTIYRKSRRRRGCRDCDGPGKSDKACYRGSETAPSVVGPIPIRSTAWPAQSPRDPIGRIASDLRIGGSTLRTGVGRLP